jgi:hypothetical protein
MLRRQHKRLKAKPLPTQAWLLAGLLLAYAVMLGWSLQVGRPGFLGYDEEGLLDKLQAAREGTPLHWAFGAGSLSTGLIWLLSALCGPQLFWIRLPSLLASLAAAVFLFQLVRPHLGERAAAWSVLAFGVNTTSFALARGCTAVPLATAAFLGLTLLLERLEQPRHWALWGLGAALMSLDYEGWLLALPVLVGWAFWRLRQQAQAQRLALASGLAFGLALIVAIQPEWKGYLQSRAAISGAPRPWNQAWQNLQALLGGGDRVLISGAPGDPWPPLWSLTLTLPGLPVLWRRWRWLLAALPLGLSPLGLLTSDGEPHRFYVAFLVLCVAAGAGAERLLARPTPLRHLPLLLLLAGAIQSVRAWTAVPAARLAQAYGRSQGLAAAADFLRATAPPDGWRILSGLGAYSDGAFRYLCDASKVKRGSRPVALIAWDYLPALVSLEGYRVSLPATDGRAFTLFFPAASAQARLEKVLQELTALRRHLGHASPVERRRLLQEALDGDDLRDPWSRTVAWELWMEASLQMHDVDPERLNRAAREPLLSGWIFDAAARHIESADPLAAQRLRRRALRADPRRADLFRPYAR